MRLMTLLSPASMNFLAGLFAGAGINMVTSVATGPPGGIPTGRIALDALLWVVAAAFLTWAARLVESAERAGESKVMGPDYNDAVRQDVVEHHLDKVRGQVRLALLLTLLSAVAAIVLLPGFIT